MTVTRATTATRVDENDLVSSVASNVPRIDYTGGGCPSILLEPQRTNLALYSEDFNDASWDHNANITVTSSSELAPNGNLEANLIEYDGSGYSFIRRTTIAPSTATLSVFAKKGNWRYLGLRNFQTSGIHTVFDFDTETFTNIASGQTASFEIFSNGWYRIKVTQPSPGNNLAGFAITNSSGGEANSTGGQVANIHLWGAQLEAGAYATSYIPTTTASVTRNADVISKTGISDLIGSTEGTIFCQLQALANYSDFSRISISGANANDKISIGYNFGNGIQAVVSVAGSLIVNFNVGGNPITNNNKIAFKYQLNSFTLFVNGVSLATLSSGAIFSASTLTNIYFTDGDGSSYPIYGKLSSLALWKTALTDQECINLTTL